MPPPPGPEWLDEPECYGCFRTKPDENDGREFFYSALWHNETNYGDGHRIVKGRFVSEERFLDLLRLARRGAEAEDTLAKLPRTRDGTPSRLNPDDIKLSVEEVTNMLRQAEHADPSLRKFFDDIGHTALLRDWLRLRARGAEVPRGNGGERGE